MAPALGRTDPSLIRQLLDSPWDFDFFQAVRLLALIYPNRRPVSGFRQPLAESVRFHANLSMNFPASAIQELAEGEKPGDPAHMAVNFMGLTGPSGMLPTHYTEYLIARSYAGDGAAAAFFDLFNHRLISLLYLAWEKHHFPVLHERERAGGGEPRGLNAYLYDLIGMGTPSLQDRLDIPATALLAYCGLLAQRPHSASALGGMLRDYFQEPVEIEQFVGTWCSLADSSLSQLGEESASSQLGCGAIAGSQVWNPQARFRVRVGPVGWAHFQNFLPGGSALGELVSLTRHFVDWRSDFEVQCVLKAGELPWCELGDGSGSPRLGLSTWLKTEPFEQDAADLVLSVAASAGEPLRRAAGPHASDKTETAGTSGAMEEMSYDEPTKDRVVAGDVSDPAALSNAG